MIIIKRGVVEQVGRNDPVNRFFSKLLGMDWEWDEQLCIREDSDSRYNQLGLFNIKKPHEFKVGDRINVFIDTQRFARGGIIRLELVSRQPPARNWLDKVHQHFFG